jgi:hypothetical protein
MKFLLLLTGTIGILFANTEVYTCMSEYYYQRDKGQYIFSDAERLKFGSFVFYKNGDSITDQGGLKFRYKNDIYESKLYIGKDGTGLLLESVKNGINKTSIIGKEGNSYTSMMCVVHEER